MRPAAPSPRLVAFSLLGLLSLLGLWACGEADAPWATPEGADADAARPERPPAPDGPEARPRLSDQDTADLTWARGEAIAIGCGDCHRSALADDALPADCPSVAWCRTALSYFDLDQPMPWTDSADDPVLRALAGGYRLDLRVRVPPALPSSDPDRLTALVERELVRRATPPEARR